jgi:hypothetical protein
MIRNWLGMRLLLRNMRALNAGDIGPTLRMEGTDVHFRFPGSSSFSADLHGRERVGEWLQRMVDTGITHQYDELVMSGPPWRMTICLRGHDWLDGPGGQRVYENRYVIWGSSAWGKLRDYEVYEDTERTTELDRYLERLPAAT